MARLKIKLKIYGRQFAIGAILITSQSICEMLASLPRAPGALRLRNHRFSRFFRYSGFPEVPEALKCLLEVRTVAFSSDSSRKWPSMWSVAENLDWSWQRSLLCRRMLGSVSGYHSLSQTTIPHCRFIHLAKIEESAT